MHSLQAPLNELLKKEKDWIWTTECKEAFKKIKEVLTSDLFITHYNPDLEIIVPSDTNWFSIGACILYKMEDRSLKPISHALKTLLPAEKNYSQIKKEALGIIFAVTKFHRFIHGRHFILQTDHKPLLTIYGSKKGLPTHTANRLQRWGTILLNYNFAMEFHPSSKISHANGLSILIPKHTEPLEDTVIIFLRTKVEVKNTLCNTVRDLPVILGEIKEKAFDDSMKKIKNKIKYKNQQISDAYSVCNEVVMYSDLIVIPTALQKRILKEFYVSHLGMSRMKSLMRSYVNWTYMNRNIKNTVKACKGCALVAKKPPIKLSPWPKTNQP